MTIARPLVKEGTMPDFVTLADLLVAIRFDESTKEWIYRPATLDDLASALFTARGGS